MKSETGNIQNGISAVLLYHRIGFPNPFSKVSGQYVTNGVFTNGLRYFEARGWDSVPIDAMIANNRAEKNSGNRFAVTFDDAYLSVYDRALPILMGMGIPATIYVVASEIGGSNNWDSAVGDCTEALMSGEQIQEASSMGFEIGSHTMTHAHLTRLSDEQLRNEMVDSKRILEDLLGKPVKSVSYPYGDCDRRVVDSAMDAGYEYAVATTRGTFSPNDDLFLIPRINVRYNGIGTVLMNKIKHSLRRSGDS